MCAIMQNFVTIGRTVADYTAISSIFKIYIFIRHSQKTQTVTYVKTNTKQNYTINKKNYVDDYDNTHILLLFYYATNAAHKKTYNDNE